MAAVTKEEFGKFMEEFRGLQVQVSNQDKTMKKYTDALTNSEGILNEKLEARLAEAVREMSNRADETKTDAKDVAMTTCRQQIGDNNKVMQDNVDFIKEHLSKVKEDENVDRFYMGKLQNIEGEIEDHSKRIANLEVSPGVGEPPTGPSRYRMDEGSEASDEWIAKLEEQVDRTRQVTDNLNERLMEVKRQFGDHKDDNHKGSSGLGKLVNLKDTNVEKLTDNISKGDFTGWVDEVMMHPRSATGWANATPLLKAMRNEKRPSGGR